MEILQEIAEALKSYAINNGYGKVSNTILVNNQGFAELRASTKVLQYGSTDHEGNLTHLYGKRIFAANIPDRFKVGYME